MEFFTRIDIPKTIFSFDYEDKTLMLGSCFVENIGQKLAENKFTVDINPFGTLYNPASVAQGIRLLLQPKPFGSNDLFQHEGVFHSFTHHSRFSSTSEEECLRMINQRLASSAEFLRNANRLIITFGTAYVYRLKASGEIVANCHKLPEKEFIRQRLSVDEIVNDWKLLLQALWTMNPALKILFTVSPIRHWKDGAHENQLSKSTLLLAIDDLQKQYPKQIAYFPAYEIVLDELRDYRFYASDMIHPSTLTIDYLWQRFTERFLSEQTVKVLKQWKEIEKAINHKPFQPESEGYKRFMLQTLSKMEQLKNKMASFDIEKEIELVKSKLK